MGVRSRGPYAPVRQQPGIDWAAQAAARDALLAEQARVEEQSRRSLKEFRGEADPLGQLVKRCHAIEARQDAFGQRIDLLGEQLQTIINILKEGGLGA